MRQRRPLGLLIPKAKAPSRSMSQLCIKGHWKVDCPNPPPGIWTFPPGSEQESSNPALPNLLTLTAEDWRCPGPHAPTLITSKEPRVTLTVASMISFLIDTEVTYSSMPAYSGKTKVSQVSVIGVDGLISIPRITKPLPCTEFPSGSEDKVSACSVEGLGSIPGLERSPGEGNGNPLQYSCLENPMDGGAWQATVHGVAKSLTWLHFTLLLPCTHQDTSFSHFFSHTPKMPHSYSWERPSLKIQSLCYYPKPTFWSSLVTAPYHPPLLMFVYNRLLSVFPGKTL